MGVVRPWLSGLCVFRISVWVQLQLPFTAAYVIRQLYVTLRGENKFSPDTITNLFTI